MVLARQVSLLDNSIDRANVAGEIIGNADEVCTESSLLF